MTPEAVDKAKSRVLARLRTEFEEPPRLTVGHTYVLGDRQSNVEFPVVDAVCPKREQLTRYVLGDISA